MIGGAAARGDHPAIVDSATGETTSYAELAARVDAVAASLQGQGVGRGDVVALIGPNSAVWGSRLPRDPARGRSDHPDQSAAHPDEVAKQAGDAAAKLAIDDPAAHGRRGQIRAEPDGRSRPRRSRRPSLLEWDDRGHEGCDAHRNLVANIEQAWTSMPIADDDTLVGLLPFFHYGQTVVLNLGLAKGATIVTMPRFNLDGLLDILERHRVTWLHIAPPVVLAFATAPQVEDRDLSALKMVISGAAPLDEDLARRRPRSGSGRRSARATG